MLSAVQIILLGFILFAITRTYLQFQRKTLPPYQFLFWMVLWSVIGSIVIIPDIASRLAELTGVGRGADLVVYAAIALIFYLQFHLMVAIDRIDQDITNLISALALKDLEREQKEKK